MISLTLLLFDAGPSIGASDQSTVIAGERTQVRVSAGLSSSSRRVSPSLSYFRPSLASLSYEVFRATHQFQVLREWNRPPCCLQCVPCQIFELVAARIYLHDL